MTLHQLKYALVTAECGSMNEASKKLFISQPSLSETIKELEDEIGITLFRRTNRGICVTAEGEEFLLYASQVSEQYKLLEEKYIEKTSKKKFSVSMQHYTFAVEAFIETVKKFGMENYEFAVHETRTLDVIENVKTFKSELGVIFLTDFNEQIMRKILRENNLDFTELFSCETYAYLCAKHPLANRSEVSIHELDEYPCLVFDQGGGNSFFLSEEVMSTYDYKKIIKASDRATLLNLMIGLLGYTLCSGIICEELNGDEHKAVKLKESEQMRIGYISRKGSQISELGKIYIEELKKYEHKVL